ncbi:MAG: hypothetical protein KAT62_00125 [Desulfuromonadales bacterium]|nr:hypothetical protein [Desulfuromonadales bacterium]
MKFILLLIILFCPVYSMSSDLRNSNWGDSQDAVRHSEKSELVHDKIGQLGYIGKISGIDVAILFIFIEDKLARVIYNNQEKHFKANNFIDDYKKFKELLTKKYGEPNEDKIHWKNDMYKDDYQNWGTAIAMGQLVLGSQWNFGSSNIFNVLNGDNLENSHLIVYTSKELESLLENKEENDSLDQL